jgi:hypothetical protein
LRFIGIAVRATWGLLKALVAASFVAYVEGRD